MKELLVAGIMLIAGTALGGTGIGTWRNYTCMNQVRSLARAGSTEWAATNGGLFSWAEGSATYQRFTNAEGLRSFDLTAVAVDGLGNVWTGASDGLLQVYTPAQSAFRILFDISTVTTQTDKRINSFTVSGDTLLICTNFGLSIFNDARFEFGDTYTKFGSTSATVKFAVLSSLIYNGRLYATLTDNDTTNVLASARLGDPNILSPEAWTLLPIGASTNTPGPLAQFNGRLYIGTASGLYIYDGSTLEQVAGLAGRNIVALAPGTASIVACAASGEVDLVAVDNSVRPYGTALPFTPASVTTGSSGNPVVGTLGGGMMTLEGSWVSHLPNGPAGNQFLNVVVDPDGVVWAASGQENGQGLYRFNGQTWKSFTTQNSALPVNEVYRVSVACDGTVWASTYGSGIVEIDRGADSVRSDHIFGQNVGMVGLPNSRAFIVPSNVVCDPSGITWMDISQAADNRGLTARRPDGTWLRLPAIDQGIILDLLGPNPKNVDRCLTVDASGNLWAAARDNNGIVSFNNAATIDSVIAYQLTTNDGLPSNTVNTLLTDRDGTIWVGTDHGIAILLDPTNPKAPGSMAAYKPLMGLNINAIAVDPLNQKWVATSEGVVLLSPDGTDSLANYTVENTNGKLIDNDVRSIAIDATSGTVYFGTASGLASLTTTAVAPRESFAGLKIFPNPYRVPAPVELTVDGLVEGSTLKILTYDGRLVREVKTPGGRVGFWDGKDEAGNLVSSGVYIVVAYSEDGTRVTSGKVAVLRK